MPQNLYDQAITSHADETMDGIHGGPLASISEGPRPAQCVKVVGVEQCPIDIEQNAGPSNVVALLFPFSGDRALWGLAVNGGTPWVSAEPSRTDAEPLRQERRPSSICATGTVDPAPRMGTGGSQNRPRTKVPARPRPGIGRKINCWWSCDVPPFMAPPFRLASFFSSFGGVKTWRPRMEARNPGANSSTRCSSRSAMASSSSASHFPEISPPASWCDLSGHVGIGPGRLGAGGLPGRIRHGLLPEEHERSSRDRVGGEVGGPPSQMVETIGEVHRAGESSVGCRPRDGTVERPIDFYGAGVPLKPRQIRPQRRGKGSLTEEILVQLGSVDIGQDCTASEDLFTAHGAHPDGAPIADDDLIDSFSASELAAGTLEAGHQRRGERARSPFGDGKAHSLRQGTEHPPEEPATRRLGTEVGMKSVAGQEEGSTLTAKVLLSQTTHGRDARSPQLEQALQRRYDPPAAYRHAGAEMGSTAHGGRLRRPHPSGP